MINHLTKSHECRSQWEIGIQVCATAAKINNKSHANANETMSQWTMEAQTDKYTLASTKRRLMHIDYPVEMTPTAYAPECNIKTKSK